MYTVIRAWDGLAWFVWVAAGPFMLLLIHRFPLSRGRIRSSIGGLLAGSLLLYLVVTHVRYFLHMLPDIIWAPGRDWCSTGIRMPTTRSRWRAGFPHLLRIFCHVVLDRLLLPHPAAHRGDDAAAAKAARLQSDLARAELAALRGTAAPAFLFNSFNALSTLVRQQKNDQAVEIIAQLSELLRLDYRAHGFAANSADPGA
ncbi:MAG: histidine kinase [Lacunisphaera sp.]